MGTPNAALRAARNARLMSQDDLARALRDVGCVSATKRLVQRWESGYTTNPRPSHARALEKVMGLPIESLGFGAVMAGRSLSGGNDAGHEVDSDIGAVPREHHPASGRPPQHSGTYSGIWLSRYEFYSSGREQTFTSSHYVIVLQHDNQLTVRSLPGSAKSSLELDLTVDGHVATGIWSERTASQGYYRGAKYHGAIQLLIELTGTRMAGKWVGFGKNFDVNVGPWELILQDRSTSKATIETFDRPAAGS
ncbi:helix-turn-helix domain-containing protein [Nocardia wallacei]|uniref:helix-turn-helix domain-containing protein n=1 Tax=Nocardia wallacei TaxID=480035 RepID=UPI002457EC49|nr:helix-turn-helix transcriptional regulator [Nocardia wallacei]